MLSKTRYIKKVLLWKNSGKHNGGRIQSNRIVGHRVKGSTVCVGNKMCQRKSSKCGDHTVTPATSPVTSTTSLTTSSTSSHSPPPSLPPPPHHRKNQTIVDPNLNNHVFYVCYLQVSLCTMILPLMRSLAWSYQYQFCLKMVTLCVQCCLIQALQFHYWVKNENVTLTFLQHHLIHIITLLRVSATL